MSENIVSIHNLDFSYGLVRVLKNISLEVKKGEFLALIGPNGGGKTTLLKLILGLVSAPANSIKVFGRDPGQSNSIGYVPQHTTVRPGFPITVLQTVLMGIAKPKLRPFYSPQEKDQARRTLVQAGLNLDLQHRRLTQLSGGQCQRVLIARALVSSPELLIFDEPTSNIDPQGKFCIYELLAQIKEQHTIIVVSHDLSVTAAHITSLACVNGRLIYNKEPKINEAMMKLIYGTHDHTCPIGDYIQDVSAMLMGDRA